MSTPGSRPFISVVIPAYNEASSIGAALCSVRDCRTEYPYELIVVDNASTDRTAEEAAKLADRVVREPRRGPGRARWRGFAAARGQVLACTDADTHVAPDWLQVMGDCLGAGSSRIAGVYGPVLSRERDLANVISTDVIFKSFLLVNRAVGIPHFIGMNFAISRWAYRACGGIDPHVRAGAEVELCQRAKEYGPIRYVPALKVTTSMRRFRGRNRVTQSMRYFINYLDICWLDRPPRNAYLPLSEVEH